MKTHKTVQAGEGQAEHNHIAQAARAAPVSQLADTTAITSITSTANSFIDTRPQALVQGRFQQMADQGQHTTRLKTLQTRMDDSAQALQMQNRAQRMQAALPTTPGAGSAVRQARSDTPANTTGMPDNLKSGIESLSGMAMDDVKVHYNSDQPASMQAHAYAQGADIHIAPGQEQHLPHEAWHVVQQRQGRVKPSFQMKSGVSINDDVALESEADVMGARALSAGTVQKVAAEEDHEGVFQKMAVSSGPVFQLTRMSGTLSPDKKNVSSPAGGARAIPEDAVWHVECLPGQTIYYEWDVDDRIVTDIYGPDAPPAAAPPAPVPAKKLPNKPMGINAPWRDTSTPAVAADKKPNKPPLPAAGAEIKAAALPPKAAVAATATGNAAAGAGAEIKKATPAAAAAATVSDKDAKAKVPAAASAGKPSALEALEAKIKKMPQRQLKIYQVYIPADRFKHVWFAHTPRGIFDAKGITSKTQGTSISVFYRMSLTELTSIMEDEAADTSAYIWSKRSGAQVEGQNGFYRMTCENIGGHYYIDTFYPLNASIDITKIRAALRVHADDYDAFLTAIGF
ncbi:DUF4157 domain-containing protein [Undibacterium sp. TJN19]|uniref:eCIS core domain-containing protein n=1 Tax=Undibacterium sp. TJN19 TaxID=3413055 RepID=UPI003BF3545B